jgi:hypothetical protein
VVATVFVVAAFVVAATTCCLTVKNPTDPITTNMATERTMLVVFLDMVIIY